MDFIHLFFFCFCCPRIQNIRLPLETVGGVAEREQGDETLVVILILWVHAQ